MINNLCYKINMDSGINSLDMVVSDMELAMFLISHIKNPCIDLNTDENIRQFYLNEAQRILDNDSFKNLYARNLIERTISEYLSDCKEE